MAKVFAAPTATRDKVGIPDPRMESGMESFGLRLCQCKGVIRKKLSKSCCCVTDSSDAEKRFSAPPFRRGFFCLRSGKQWGQQFAERLLFATRGAGQRETKQTIAVVVKTGPGTVAG